jgi:cytoskeleton protein RodZ
MSENTPRDTEPQTTAGGMLRAARQAQGIQLVSLAAQLKIAPRKLEALENDQLDELQGPTFVRALAQASCRVLKIDPAPVLARLPRHESSTLEQVSGGLNAPFKERGGNRLMTQWMSENRWTLSLGLVFVLGALVLFLAPPGFGLSNLRAGATAAVGQAASAGVAAAELTASAATMPQAASIPDAQASSASAPAAARSASALAPFVASVAASSVVPASQPRSAAPATVPPPLSEGSSVTIQIAALEASWVEVRDSRGKVVFGRQLQAGEVAGLEGVFPMRVKIGNAAGTTLSVRGQAVDLGPVTRDNVARLELK